MNLISNSSDRFTNFVTMNLQKWMLLFKLPVQFLEKFVNLLFTKNLWIRCWRLSVKLQTFLRGQSFGRHIFWTIFLKLNHCAPCGSSPRFWQINRNSIELGNWISLEFKQGISPLGSSQTIDWEGRRQCIFAQRNDPCCIKLNH